MRNIKLFKSMESFLAAYHDDNGGPAYFTCSGGTFNYDKPVNSSWYLWKNGDIVLGTPLRTPKVGAWDLDAGTAAYDENNDNPVEILTVGEVMPGEYKKPWVSCTKYEVNDSLEANVTGSISGQTYDNKVTFIKTNETYSWVS